MRINATLTILCIGIAIGTDAQVISRLKAKAVMDHDGTTYIHADSSTYNYSYSRGSDMKTGLYSFDTSVSFLNNGSGRQQGIRYIRTYENNTALRVQSETSQLYISNTWENSQRKTFHYPTALGTGNLTKTDTLLTEQWNKLDGRWHLLKKQVTNYNANQAVTSELELLFDDPNGMWMNNREITYTYISNRLITRLEREWNTGNSSWVNVQRTDYIYNTTGLIKDTTQRWNTSTTAWDRLYKNEYTYNAGGNNNTLIYSVWNGTEWVLKTRNQYEYTGTIAISDTFSSWDAGMGQWTSNWLYTYDYDNAQNLLKEFTRTPGPDSFMYYRLKEWTYNSYNQPTQINLYEWNFTTKSWQSYTTSNAQQNFYYELFNTSVKDIAHNDNSLSIYPIPAKDFLHISLEPGEQGPIHISIYDLHGRTVKHYTGNYTGRYEKNIIVSDLPTGQYILKAVTHNKEMTKSLIIQR